MPGENNVICIDWSSDEDLQEVLWLTASDTVSQPPASQRQQQQQRSSLPELVGLPASDTVSQPAASQRQQRQHNPSGSSLQEVLLLSASSAGGSSSAAALPKRLGSYPVPDGLAIPQKPHRHLPSSVRGGELCLSFFLVSSSTFLSFVSIKHYLRLTLKK